MSALLGAASGVSPKGSTILLESEKRKLSDDLPEPEGEKRVKALSLTASLAAFNVAGFTEDERCPVGECRRSSDGLK